MRHQYLGQVKLVRASTICLLMCSLFSSVSFARTDSRKSRKLLPVYQKQYADLNKKFFTQVEELAQFCERNKLANEAKQIRSIIKPVDPSVSKLLMLPSNIRSKIPHDLSVTQKHWQMELRRYQTEHARQLYLLSRRFLKIGASSFAYQLVHETAHYDSDNRSARRLLGFVRAGNQWVTPYAAKMLKRKYVQHEKFGWIPQSKVAKYEKGERYYKGRWVSIAKEAELRRDFKNAWKVETDHFEVRTNHSLEQGVKIANGLEDYYSFYFQTYIGFFNTPEQLSKLFSGGSGKSGYRKKKHVVHYYRTRDEYNKRLVSQISLIAMTHGVYIPQDRVVYSFHNPETDRLETLYHESSHQLFYESTARQREIAKQAHFWAIEGIACYMESFEQNGKKLSLGKINHPRFVNARRFLLADNYYIGLENFSAMGQYAYQNDKNIVQNYAQGAGLAHFFMHYKKGIYRDAFIAHLSQLYAVPPRGRRIAPVQTMEELTETSYRQLDEQYRNYMKEIQIALQSNQTPQQETP